MFERESPLDGSRYSQAHVTATTLSGILNVHNYSALLGFTQGNLTEVPPRAFGLLYLKLGFRVLRYTQPCLSFRI